MKMRIILGLLVVGGLSVWLSSCKDDEVPKSGVSFELEGESVTESNATLESFHPRILTGGVGRNITVKIILDKPLAETAVISYSIGGTATKNSTATPYGDFDIVGNGENITIQKGESESTITIKLYEDERFETEVDDDNGFFETIELTLETVVSGTAIIGEQKKYTLKIYEDDALIILDWDPQDVVGTGRGDVDMDIILHLDGEITWVAAAGGSANPEAMNIPPAFPDGNYGLSYNYYSGTSDALAFTVEMFNLGGMLNGVNKGLTPLEFTGNLTQANTNEWDSQSNSNYKSDPVIVQTMVKTGFDYASISATITKPDVSSRIKSLSGSIKSRSFYQNEENLKEILKDLSGK